MRLETYFAIWHVFIGHAGVIWSQKYCLCLGKRYNEVNGLGILFRSFVVNV